MKNMLKSGNESNQGSSCKGQCAKMKICVLGCRAAPSWTGDVICGYSLCWRRLNSFMPLSMIFFVALLKMWIISYFSNNTCVIFPPELLSWSFIVCLLQWALNDKQLCCDSWNHLTHFGRSLTATRWLIFSHKSLWQLDHPQGNQWEINDLLQTPAVQSVVVLLINTVF